MNLVLLNEHVASQTVEQVVHGRLVARQRVIIIESIDLDLLQVELVARKNALRIYILRKLLR